MGAIMSAAREYELESDHHWPRPPEGGWTADDLDELPNLPPHTELIDGSLVFVSPQTRFHTLVMRLLENSLFHQVPEGLNVTREMSIKLNQRNRPEPDIIVYRAEADTDDSDLVQTWYDPKDVVLAVEVVSPDSVDRDRDAKPRKYAKAGIRFYWRVEKYEGLPVVYAYELDPAVESYKLIDIFHDKLVLKAPFPIEIDLTALTRRPPAHTSLGVTDG
jgi:Uma2 family endonuclease